MVEAHLRDAVALCEHFSWMEEQMLAGATVTEVELDAHLTAQRAAQPGYVGPSFPTIAGCNGNGAIIHYRAEEGSCATIDKSCMLLVDSGGQYDCGTTDITRTFHFGEPTQHQRDCYTRVLQARRFPAVQSHASLLALCSRVLAVLIRSDVLAVLSCATRVEGPSCTDHTAS